jgi:hypothetical protein
MLTYYPVLSFSGLLDLIAQFLTSPSDTCRSLTIFASDTKRHLTQNLERVKINDGVIVVFDKVFLQI